MEPSYDDLADVLTANLRSMKYMEANMNGVMQAANLLIMTFAVIVLLLVGCVLIRKAMSK